MQNLEPIKSKEELNLAIKTINSLLDKPLLTQEERDYLNALGDLVYKYEKELDIIPDISGVEMLKVLMVEHELAIEDLEGALKDKTIVGKILKQEAFLIEELEEIAKFFRVSPLVFLPKQ